MTKTVKNDKLITSGTSSLNQHAEQCLSNKSTVLSDVRLNFKKLNVKISKEDQVWGFDKGKSECTCCRWSFEFEVL